VPVGEVLIKTAYFIYPVYFNEANGYCVFQYRDSDTGDRFTCVGTGLPDNKKIRYNLTCKIVENKKYGQQYEMVSFEENIGNSRDDIIDYLTSGNFKGVGPVLARRIFDKFGKDTLSVIENEPERFLEIKGITKKKLEDITDGYRSSKREAEIYKLLIPFGFTSKQIHTLCTRYKSGDLAEYIKSNPYKLCRLRGVTFEMADELAMELGFSKTSWLRVTAVAVDSIKKEMKSGHVAVEAQRFAALFVKSCSCPEITMKTWWRYIFGPLTEGNVKLPSNKRSRFADPKEAGPIQTGEIKRVKKTLKNSTEDWYYLWDAYEAERELAEKAVSFLNLPKEDFRKELKAEMSGLDGSQKEAVKISLKEPFSIITGGPGTGKTTIIKLLARLYKEKYPDREVILLAPTGKAARRMSQATGLRAQTIHSYLKLGVNDGNEDIKKESDVEITDSLVIIDESSMVDLWVARVLFNSISDSKVILVGDIDQLPSVGSGSVLKDMMESGEIPVSTLRYVHRQKEGSTICDNADLIRNGDPELEEADDFRITYIKEAGINTTDEMALKAAEDEMIKRYMEDISQFGKDNVICLCPYKKYAAGTRSVNARIQELLNPLGNRREVKGRNGDLFRVGDPVMQLINTTIETDDGTEYISNGDIGRVVDLTKTQDGDTVVVRYENGAECEYSKADTEMITLAYAITVHKSQGSEYDSVVTCLTDAHRMMLYRKVLYTAITRGAKKVTLVGTETAVRKAVSNTEMRRRNTGLMEAIREEADSIRIGRMHNAG